MAISAPPTPPQQARTRRAALAVGTFLLWTLFVWGGRIRNALGDPELDDGGRTGPLLLSVSFVVPSVVLVVAVIVAQRRRRSLAPAASALLRVLVAWTTVLWLFRAGDIVLTSDEGVAFVVVHVVLAVVSIALGAWAVAEDRRARSGAASAAVAPPR